MTAIKNDSGFKFECPHCSQSLEATTKLIGESLDCPTCGKGMVVPAPKNEWLLKVIASAKQNLIVTVSATVILTSAFWWITPFIARAKGKQAAEGAMSALREGFESSKEERREKTKLESVAKDKIALNFEGNQRVTITNNSDFEIEYLAFFYTNAENLRVADGSVRFSNKALKSGQSVTMDISSKETIKPEFKVHPSCVGFTSVNGLVSLAD